MSENGRAGRVRRSSRSALKTKHMSAVLRESGISLMIDAGLRAGVPGEILAHTANIGSAASWQHQYSERLACYFNVEMNSVAKVLNVPHFRDLNLKCPVCPGFALAEK